MHVLNRFVQYPAKYLYKIDKYYSKSHKSLDSDLVWFLLVKMWKIWWTLLKNIRSLHMHVLNRFVQYPAKYLYKIDKYYFKSHKSLDSDLVWFY